MKHSESVSEVLPAVFAAKSAFMPVIKDKKNEHFKSTYADLRAYFGAIDKAIEDNKLLLSQATCVTEHGGIIVETRLTHVPSGQWIGSTYPVKAAQQTPQAEGSALTFARRYALSSLLGLAAEDDDGNAASTVAADKRTRLINKGIEKARNGEYDEWQACLTKSERILLGKDALEKIAGEAA